MEVMRYECRRCGHSWIPRKEIVKFCPNCNSPYWNKPRSLKGDGRKITTIKITVRAYEDLLLLKNYMSMKLRGITNPEITDGTKITDKVMKSVDLEPEYTVSMCISDTVASVMNEQQTGEVNFIT